MFYSEESKINSTSRYSVMIMSKKKYDMIKKLQSYNCSDEKKNFVIPGLLSSNVTQDAAFKNFTSPLDNRGDFVKVMFKISYDKFGTEECRTSLINLSQELSFTPEIQ